MTRLVASSLLLASCLVGSEAFIPTSHGITSTAAAVRPQSTLNALFSSDDDQTGESDADLSRRDVGSRIAVLASAFATTFTSTDAFAEEEGRLIKFEVQNLDGGDSGSFTVRTRPDWAPKGVQRFEALTENKFWDGCRVFRVLPGFIAQFGINGDPQVQSKWRASVSRINSCLQSVALELIILLLFAASCISLSLLNYQHHMFRFLITNKCRASPTIRSR